MRSGGTWDPLRTPVDASSDSPSIMVRAPNDASYGVDAGGLYWKGSTSQTYFYHIPEFEEVILPITGSIPVALFLRRRTRSARRDAAASCSPETRRTRGSVPRQEQVVSRQSGRSLDALTLAERLL